MRALRTLVLLAAGLAVGIARITADAATLAGIPPPTGQEAAGPAPQTQEEVATTAQRQMKRLLLNSETMPSPRDPFMFDNHLVGDVSVQSHPVYGSASLAYVNVGDVVFFGGLDARTVIGVTTTTISFDEGLQHRLTGGESIQVRKRVFATVEETTLQTMMNSRGIHLYSHDDTVDSASPHKVLQLRHFADASSIKARLLPGNVSVVHGSNVVTTLVDLSKELSGSTFVRLAGGSYLVDPAHPVTSTQFFLDRPFAGSSYDDLPIFLDGVGAGILLEVTAGQAGLGEDASSGSIEIGSGVGKAGPSGVITLSSGDAKSGSGPNLGGDIELTAADAVSLSDSRVTGGSISGDIDLRTTPSATTGSITLVSGTSSSGNSGSVSVLTSGASGGASGSIIVRVGSGDAAVGGNVDIGSGESTKAQGVGGRVLVQGGTGVGTGGNVELSAGSVSGQTAGVGGKVLISSGTSDTAASGEVAMSSAVSKASTSGAVRVSSGAASAGNSGTVSISTGASTGGASGSISLSVGSGDSPTGGAVYVDGGTSTGTGGVVKVRGGTGSSVGGDLTLEGGA
uniref:Uncharacterized protein n=1 Tax=Phytophthora ramorum TaxID=164328 RepID=H3H8H8_PHYRM